MQGLYLESLIPYGGGGLNLMEFDSRMMMVRYPVTDFRRYLAIAGREIIIISNNWSYALALRF